MKLGISRRSLVQFTVAAAGAAMVVGRGRAAALLGAGGVPVVLEKVKERLHSLPFQSQKIGGVLAKRMKINVDGRLQDIDEGPLLTGFTRRNRGGDPEGAWLGEHVGKFLDAACNALRYRDDPLLRRKAQHMVDVLIASQEPDGYLGTYPDAQRWIGVKRERSWDVWVHKYCLIGLLAWHELSGDPAALAACRKVGNLLIRIFGDSPGQLDIVTIGEHMGMASTSVLEPMVALYRFTGAKRYLDFCHYIVRAWEHEGGPRILSSLLAHGSVRRTANGKAYEMLSNLNGVIDLYRVTGDKKLLRACLAAWNDIVRNQLYPTGTMSAAELFQPDGHLLSLHASKIGETCVTVTWLQFNLRLFRLTGEARYGQEVERTLYNHLLGAQDVRTGDFSYYTGLAEPKWFRSEVLCCVSSGPRGIALIPALAWGIQGDAFVVNLYTSGRARFEIDGTSVEIVSESDFPDDGTVRLTIDVTQPVHFTLRLRVPEWANDYSATVGSSTFTGTPGQMLDIRQIWQPGSEAVIHMDMPVRVLPGGPAYPDFIALQRGPQVLTMEKSVNLGVPWLHRVGLVDAATPVIMAVGPGEGRPSMGLYETDALVGIPALSQELNFEPRKIRLVPFADGADCRIWMARPGHLRRDIPAATAYADAALSEQKHLPEAEFLTDENPATFAIADPRNHRLSAYLGKPAGKKGDNVWFASLAASNSISLILFRHGPMRAEGGWFDSSEGPPQVEILAEKGAPWVRAGNLDLYPRTSASSPAGVADGQKFELRLERLTMAYAVRVIGKSGGDYVSCGELAAFG